MCSWKTAGILTEIKNKVATSGKWERRRETRLSKLCYFNCLFWGVGKVHCCSLQSRRFVYQRNIGQFQLPRWRQCYLGYENSFYIIRTTNTPALQAREVDLIKYRLPFTAHSFPAWLPRSKFSKYVEWNNRAQGAQATWWRMKNECEVAWKRTSVENAEFKNAKKQQQNRILKGLGVAIDSLKVISKQFKFIYFNASYNTLYNSFLPSNHSLFSHRHLRWRFLLRIRSDIFNSTCFVSSILTEKPFAGVLLSFNLS